ncbi:MAG TPA: DUF748 domain-containing protein, partial [Terriglobales bacterium]|nr:DUF748 domain-containing protein [Terriglobales bacterium]
PWLVKIDQVNINNYGITLEDRLPSTPARLMIKPLNVKLTNVSSKLDTTVALDLSAQVNETGKVAVKGDLIADPLTFNLDLDVDTIALPPLQPYLDKVAQLDLKSGSAGVKGHLTYGPKKGTTPQMRFNGTAGIADLLTQDKVLNKDFLRWNGLTFNGVTFEWEPTSVAITEIVATKPYVRFIIGPDRTTNIQHLFAKPDSEARVEEPPPSMAGSATQSSSPPVPVRIGLIRFVDGSAHFADFSLKPIIDTGIYGLNGTIKGLSSKELTKADVSLDGKVDKYAPVAVKGTINPLTSEAFTDIGMSFKNVELTTVSPYATKFGGYPITKGKLSLDLRYKLAKHLLDAENNVVIEQLTLGDKVEGPDATSLPVKLAIALLKDRKGIIDIDLPVRGDLNDPDFKYGKVLLGVLINLVTKAVTSPFSLVGGLVGGSGEELRVVEFPAGARTLTSAEENKLKTLGKALEERPGLRLEIAGAADPKADRTALAEQKLHRDLLALRPAGTSGAAKQTGGEVDFSRLPESEQSDLIKTLYLKKFGKLPESPSTAGQAEKPAPVSIQTLKDRLLGEITIDEGELRLLAQERSRRIQEFLITQGGTPPERLYLLDIKIDAKAKDGIVASNLSLNSE